MRQITVLDFPILRKVPAECHGVVLRLEHSEDVARALHHALFQLAAVPRDDASVIDAAVKLCAGYAHVGALQDVADLWIIAQTGHNIIGRQRER